MIIEEKEELLMKVKMPLNDYVDMQVELYDNSLKIQFEVAEYTESERAKLHGTTIEGSFRFYQYFTINAADVYEEAFGIIKSIIDISKDENMLSEYLSDVFGVDI